MPDSILSALDGLTQLLVSQSQSYVLCRYYYYPHFTKDVTGDSDKLSDSTNVTQLFVTCSLAPGPLHLAITLYKRIRIKN